MQRWSTTSRCLRGTRYEARADSVAGWCLISLCPHISSPMRMTHCLPQEIDELYKIFQVLGTPNDQNWPGVSQLPEYQASMPLSSLPLSSYYYLLHSVIFGCRPAGRVSPVAAAGPGGVCANIGTGRRGFAEQDAGVCPLAAHHSTLCPHSPILCPTDWAAVGVPPSFTTNSRSRRGEALA